MKDFDEKMCKAIVTFGVPEHVVDELIERVRHADPKCTRWVVVGTNMQALSALDARWSRSVDLTIVHAPRISASALASTLEILHHELLPLNGCVWIDAGLMAPMQGQAFAQFISAGESDSAEMILDNLNDGAPD